MNAAVTTRRHVLSSLSRVTIAGFATTTTAAVAAAAGTSTAAEHHRASPGVKGELFDVLFSDNGAVLKDATLGFSMGSLEYAADQLGLSRACCAAIKPADLVHEFNRRKLVELGERFEGVGPQATMREGIRYGVRERLSLLEPFRATWASALAAIASPEEVAPTLRHVEQLTSALLTYAGDIPAADMTWYTKRMLLGGVIGLAEIQLASGEGSVEDILVFVETSLDGLRTGL